jgi:hypothetical protein
MSLQDSTSSNADLIDADDQSSTDEVFSPSKKHQTWSQIWENLLRLGLGETVLRIGTATASILLVLLVVWVMNNFYLEGQIIRASDAAIAAPLATETPPISRPLLQLPQPVKFVTGITRLAQLHTTLPAAPALKSRNIPWLRATQLLASRRNLA